MKKGCLIALAVLVAVAFGIAGVWYHFWNESNPTYHGKRLYAWVDQAIQDGDPAARKEAVQVLLEALPNLHGWPRTRLLMDFPIHAPFHEEVLPFLIEALRAGEEPSANYAGMALFLHGASKDDAALRKAFEKESDLEAKERMRKILESRLRKPDPEEPEKLP